MEEKTGKKPYTPPHITRIVLKREQAILSVCSSGAPANVPAGGPFRCTPGGCTKTPPVSSPSDDTSGS